MVGIRVNDWGAGDRKREYQNFWVEMFPHVTRAVEDSFLQANMQHPTRAEIVDRTKKAKKIVDELRNDLKWSKQRIQAELPRILRQKLLGIREDYDKLDARANKEVKGIPTSVYSVEESSATKAPVASAAMEKALDLEFTEEDLSPPGVEAAPGDVVETAPPEDVDL